MGTRFIYGSTVLASSVDCNRGQGLFIDPLFLRYLLSVIGARLIYGSTVLASSVGCYAGKGLFTDPLLWRHLLAVMRGKAYSVMAACHSYYSNLLILYCLHCLLSSYGVKLWLITDRTFLGNVLTVVRGTAQGAMFDGHSYYCHWPIICSCHCIIDFIIIIYILWSLKNNHL